MLTFGWSEITLVVIVVIIVIGPKEIPNLLRQLGRFSKSLKKTSRQFKESLNDLAEESDLKDIKKSINTISDLKKNLDPTNELKKEITSIKDTVTLAKKEIEDIDLKVHKNNK